MNEFQSDISFNQIQYLVFQLLRVWNLMKLNLVSAAKFVSLVLS